MEQDTAQTVSGPKKSKKGLIIVIIIVLLGIWLLTRGRGGIVAPGVDVDRNLDGSATYSNNEGSVTVGGGSLPDNWPSDAPTYADAKIQYSGSSNPQTGEKGAVVMFTTSDSATKVADFYKKELASSGWTIEGTANINGATVISAKKDSRTFGAQIVEANGLSTVTVGVGMPSTN